MSTPSDPRAVVEYRVPAADLTVGDLVNTSPGEGDWQEVLRVYRSPADSPPTAELRNLVSTLDGRYIVVVLSDLVPVDGGIYFVDGTALIAGADEAADQSVADAVGSAAGERIYLYTRFELVTVRTAR